jgi:endonuclease-3
MVTKSLFKKYQNPADYLSVPFEELEKDIHSCGTFRMKTKAIRETCGILLRDFGGQVPKTMQEMLTLRGVGRKTASVVLSTAYGVHEGIAVDTHVTRVAKRLGLTRSKAQGKIESDLMKLYDRKDWGLISHVLIFHGRTVCFARGHDCHCREVLLAPRFNTKAFSLT